jgi:DNA uptake protein ComE-like DNA-binding protein
VNQKHSAIDLLNEADEIEFMSIYGIGPKISKRIIDHRMRCGDFVNFQELT